MNIKPLIASTLVFTLGIAIAGCHSKTSDTPIPATIDSPAAQELLSDADIARMTEEMVGFSEEDRASVLKQQRCPVSGEMLGSMGAPKKIDVNGQFVWICCDGCKDNLLADPDTYLEKLAAASTTHPLTD
jgi:hypothetical protein